ncbi:MAG: rRNA maturation RNase YbeY [Saprospiraceae bacterium]
MSEMEEFFTWDASEEIDAPIEYNTEDIEFTLTDANRITNWITTVIAAEGKVLQHISYIFCSDDYLLDLNQQYLDHDTLTDIITFQYSKLPDIEGDIFISIDRVKENAHTFGVTFEEELRRVIIHGVLHLCGYGDKTSLDKARMTEKENEALQMWHLP